MPQLTDALIRNTGSQDKPVTLWDSSLKGFGCRIHPTGKKTWIVLIASGRRKALGHYPLLTLSQARSQAKTILAEKELGRTFPHFVAFDDAKRDFLADCGKKNRARTVRDYAWLLHRLPFGRQSVGDITPREIIRKLQELEDAPATKQHVFVCARTFFRWCVHQHLIDRSPMENMEAPSNGHSRERVLTPDELSHLLQCVRTHETPFHRIVGLLLLTGQRRGEIAALQWDWINEQERTITLPSTVTKNKRIHTFPYGDLTTNLLLNCPRLLGCPYVFPAARQRSEKTTVFNGWGKPKAALDCKLSHVLGGMQMEPWTLHDLRRTFSSTMAALGVPQIVVEKLLNHVSGGTQSPISQIYNRYQYLDEMHEAILKYEAYLRNLTAPRA